MAPAQNPTMPIKATHIETLFSAILFQRALKKCPPHSPVRAQILSIESMSEFDS